MFSRFPDRTGQKSKALSVNRGFTGKYQVASRARRGKQRGGEGRDKNPLGMLPMLIFDIPAADRRQGGHRHRRARRPLENAVRQAGGGDAIQLSVIRTTRGCQRRPSSRTPAKASPTTS